MKVLIGACRLLCQAAVVAVFVLLAPGLLVVTGIAVLAAAIAIRREDVA